MESFHRRKSQGILEIFQISQNNIQTFDFFSCKWSIGRVCWWIIVGCKIDLVESRILFSQHNALFYWLFCTPTESRSQNSQSEKLQLLTSLTTIQLFVDLANHFKLCTIINRGKKVEIKFHILRTVVNQVSNDATA